MIRCPVSRVLNMEIWENIMNVHARAENFEHAEQTLSRPSREDVEEAASESDIRLPEQEPRGEGDAAE